MPKNFAIFIMVHGRPDKMWTYKSLRKQGYTGKVFLVADDLDETLEFELIGTAARASRAALGVASGSAVDRTFTQHLDLVSYQINSQLTR